MKPYKNSIAQYLVLFSLVFPHPSFAMNNLNPTEEIKNDLESQQPLTPVTNPNTAPTDLNAPPQPLQAPEADRHQIGPLNEIIALIRQIISLPGGGSFLPNQLPGTTEITRQLAFNDPDIDRTNVYIGSQQNPYDLPGNTLNLGGGITGYQPTDHFNNNLTAPQYFRGIHCFFTVADGWLQLFHTASVISASSLHLYLHSSKSHDRNSIANQAAFVFDLIVLMLPVFYVYVLTRRHTLESEGYSGETKNNS